MPRFRTTDNGKKNLPGGQHRQGDAARNRVTEALSRNLVVQHGRAHALILPTKWNAATPHKVSQTVTGDYQANINQGNGFIMSVAGKTAGKWYWECTLTAHAESSGPIFGIARATINSGAWNAPFTGMPADSVTGIGIHGSGGIVERDQSTLATLGFNTAVNDTIGVLMDCDANTIRFIRPNGVVSAAYSMGNGGSGARHAAVGGATSGYIGATVIGNFGQSAFVHAAVIASSYPLHLPLSA